MSGWGRFRHMFYVYTGLASAGVLVVIVALWVATTDYALVWSRHTRLDTARDPVVPATEHQAVVLKGAFILRSGETRVPRVWFENRASMMSLSWYHRSAQWTTMMPRQERYGVRIGPSAWYASMPLWPLAIASAILPGVQLMQLIRSGRRRRYIRVHKLCPDCGYDCRATPDRCPECGKVLRASAMIDTAALEAVVDDEEPRDPPDATRAPQS